MVYGDCLSEPRVQGDSYAASKKSGMNRPTQLRLPVAREIRSSVILAEYGTADIPGEPTRASVMTF